MAHEISLLEGDRSTVEIAAARALLHSNRPEREDVLDAVADRVATVLARTPAEGSPRVVVRSSNVNVLA